MSSLRLRQLSRKSSSGSESLEFEDGVNVIVGLPNSGKTKWLAMLDYLFGSDDSPAEALGEDMAEKYSSAKVLLDIDGQEHELERRWKERGLRTKVLVDGDPVGYGAVSKVMLDWLGIPFLHYPRGSPYSGKTWPELSWRSLLRHIYRRQDFWADIADRQPPSEQHACILQFIGAAKQLFSDEYGALVESEMRLTRLQAQKETFLQVLHEVATDIIGDDELGVAVTPESIRRVVTRLSEEVAGLESRRAEHLQALHDKVVEIDPAGDSLDQLGEHAEAIEGRLKISRTSWRALTARLDELKEYRSRLSDELDRLPRAAAAGQVFAPLKVTHCPACDQAIRRAASFVPTCYVCGQETTISSFDSTGSSKRLDLELEQLRRELAEANQLIDSVEDEERSVSLKIEGVTEELAETRIRLETLRGRNVHLVSPEIEFLDLEMGRIQERVAQVGRVRRSLDRREELNAQIGAIAAEIEGLEHAVAEQKQLVDLEGPADALGDEINTYLNELNRLHPGAWSQKPVRVRLSDRQVDFRVGGASWRTQLGGTLKLYFLIAYHYAQLGLSDREGYNYPGFAILDFPPELEDGSLVRDKENFVLEPFVVRMKDISGQLIAAGSAFEGLKDANRIELKHVWR